jgi:hypothetical protein
MRNILNPIGPVFAAAVVFTAAGAHAQQIERGNPFVAPAAVAEEQARQDERTRIIFRELEPEVKNDIMRRVNESQASLEIKLRKRIDLVTQNLGASGQAKGADGKPVDEVKKSPVPEGATFVSCVNGLALYRDKNNVLRPITEEKGAADNRCEK